MKISKIENIGNFTFVSVFVEEQLWKQHQDKQYESHSNKVKIPGFRVGKAPAHIARKHLNPQFIIQESVNAAAKDAYKFAMEQEEIKALPIIEDAFKVETDNVSDTSLTIIFKFEMYPEVEISDLDSLKVLLKQQKVTQEEIDAEILKWVKQDVMLVDKEDQTIENGNVVIFDFKGIDKNGIAFEGGSASDYELEIGSKNFIPGFEEQMLGMKVNEQKDIQVTFPATYHQKELAGQEVTFKLDIKSVKKQLKPEMNEDYIAGLKIDGVKTQAEFEAFIGNNIQFMYDQSYNNTAIAEISKWLLAHAKVNFFPNSLIDSEVKRLLQIEEQEIKKLGFESLDSYFKKNNKDLKEFNEKIQENAKKDITIAMAYEKLGSEFEAEELTDEDFKNFITYFSKTNHIPEKYIEKQLDRKDSQMKYMVMQRKILLNIVKKYVSEPNE